MADTTADTLELVIDEPLLGLLRSCHINCVPACCGAEAYDVDAKHMLPWARKHGLAALATAAGQVEALLGRIFDHSGLVVSVPDDFNLIWEDRSWCWDHLEDALRQMIRTFACLQEENEPWANWLARRNETVRAIADMIDCEGDTRGLGILADAMQEAGCENQALLGHCRVEHKPFRGCWVIDLLLKQWEPIIGGPGDSPTSASGL